MKVFTGQHFTVVYLEMLQAFSGAELELVGSRAGPVLDLGRVCYELAPDGNRFCILRGRRFNPFLALAEVSWNLCGSSGVAPLAFHTASFREFSDDGESLYGAYGFRLRHPRDQLQAAVEVLRENIQTRRVVLSIWDVRDLGVDSMDIPCNTQVFFKVREGRLDMMVCNRSNDVFLGVPYNVVTFAAFQVFIAREVGIEPGWQCHVTDSLHLYERDRYRASEVTTRNHGEDLRGLLDSVGAADLGDYCRLDHAELTGRYDREVDGPGACLAARNAYLRWRGGREAEAVRILPPSDVGLSALEWFMASPKFNPEWLPEWVPARREFGRAGGLALGGGSQRGA